ncbi:hypothetical protein PtB15_13B411 [Puccinia triticina]|nr:hypothetical protein PtB15_13B411 [Puccinia triticina]
MRVDSFNIVVGPLPSNRSPSPLVDLSLPTLAGLFPGGQTGLSLLPLIIQRIPINPPHRILLLVQKLSKMGALASLDLQAPLTPKSYRQLCLKRDAIGSLEHHIFLQHLHQFLHLVS